MKLIYIYILFIITIYKINCKSTNLLNKYKPLDVNIDHEIIHPKIIDKIGVQPPKSNNLSNDKIDNNDKMDNNDKSLTMNENNLDVYKQNEGGLKDGKIKPKILSNIQQHDDGKKIIKPKLILNNINNDNCNNECEEDACNPCKKDDDDDSPIIIESTNVTHINIRKSTKFYVIGNGFSKQVEDAMNTQANDEIFEKHLELLKDNNGNNKESDELKGTGIDFIISVGDNFIDGIACSNDPKFKTNFEDLFNKDTSLKCPWYITLGDEDHKGCVNGEIQYSQNSDRWTLPAAYYKQILNIDGTDDLHGTILLVVLDTSEIVNGQGANQLVWLKNTLSNRQEDWVIVAGHHAIIANSVKENEDNSQNMDKQKPVNMIESSVLPILLDYHVDAYLTGQNHALQIHNITRNEKYIMQYMSGTGSDGHEAVVDAPAPDGVTRLYRSSNLGFLQFKIDDSEMNVAVSGLIGSALYQVKQTPKGKNLIKPKILEEMATETDEKSSSTSTDKIRVGDKIIDTTVGAEVAEENSCEEETCEEEPKCEEEPCEEEQPEEPKIEISSSVNQECAEQNNCEEEPKCEEESCEEEKPCKESCEEPKCEEELCEEEKPCGEESCEEEKPCEEDSCPEVTETPKPVQDACSCCHIPQSCHCCTKSTIPPKPEDWIAIAKELTSRTNLDMGVDE